MGFFSRTESSSASRRGTATSSDAQLAELRGRARRRLIGALMLVLAVIVVVPLLIDNGTPEPEPTLALAPAPVVVPGSTTAQPGAGLVVENISQPAVSQPESASTPPGHDQPEGDPASVLQPEPALEAPPTQAKPAAPAPSPQPTPAPKAEEKPKTSVAPPKSSSTRTDDGSVALALLEGRTPPTAADKPAKASPARGNFILQAAAYSNEKDAQSRRDQLRSAGVTNAYVESAASGGRTTYRLRVGPFSSREAAVAAQTRLRSLDYKDSFISGQ